MLNICLMVDKDHISEKKRGFFGQVAYKNQSASESITFANREHNQRTYNNFLSIRNFFEILPSFRQQWGFKNGIEEEN